MAMKNYFTECLEKARKEGNDLDETRTISLEYIRMTRQLCPRLYRLISKVAFYSHFNTGYLVATRAGYKANTFVAMRYRII